MCARLRACFTKKQRKAIHADEQEEEPINWTEVDSPPGMGRVEAIDSVPKRRVRRRDRRNILRIFVWDIDWNNRFFSIPEKLNTEWLLPWPIHRPSPEDLN